MLAILTATAVSKALAFAHPPLLFREEDQLLGVPIFWVVLAALLVEVSLILVILYCQDDVKMTLAVLAFSVVVLVYRAAAHAAGITHCACLGNITEWWPWLGNHENEILDTIACWLLITSAIQLAAARQRGLAGGDNTLHAGQSHLEDRIS